jgi:uncharacterized membrane protein YkoI
MQNRASMKKLVIAFAAVAVIALGGVIALIIFIVSQNSPEALQEPTAQSAEYAQDGNGNLDEMAAELAELQAMLDALLAGQTVEITGAAEPISGVEANDIALAYVGHGEIAGFLLFNDEGVLTYEVDIRYGIARYMVYVDAISGEVINMGRFEDNE